MILYSAADLIWATRIKGTADALGVACRPVRSVQMLEDRLKESPIKALIVDLDNPGLGLSLIQRVREVSPREDGGNIRILAFGPHVAVEAFEQARAAGADAVLARGAFDRRLPEILKELDGGGP